MDGNTVDCCMGEIYLWLDTPDRYFKLCPSLVRDEKVTTIEDKKLEVLLRVFNLTWTWYLSHGTMSGDATGILS